MFNISNWQFANQMNFLNEFMKDRSCVILMKSDDSNGKSDESMNKCEVDNNKEQINRNNKENIEYIDKKDITQKINLKPSKLRKNK